MEKAGKVHSIFLAPVVIKFHSQEGLGLWGSGSVVAPALPSAGSAEFTAPWPALLPARSPPGPQVRPVSAAVTLLDISTPDTQLQHQTGRKQNGSIWEDRRPWGVLLGGPKPASLFKGWMTRQRARFARACRAAGAVLAFSLQVLKSAAYARSS